MYAYTELASDEAPISMSAVLRLDTLEYTMCSICFKNGYDEEIEVWDNEIFIIEFCELLRPDNWIDNWSVIRKRIDEDEPSLLEVEYIITHRKAIIELYDKAREIKLL